jgi:3-dehydroquinate synthase
MNLEIHRLARLLQLRQPPAQAGQWNEMHGDVFGGNPATGMLAHQAARLKQMNELGTHPGRGRSGDQELHRRGTKAGFLEQFARGGLGQRLAEMRGLIAENPRRDFNDPPPDRDPVLLDQHDFIRGRDRQHSDAVLGMRPLHVVPAPLPQQAQPRGFIKGFDSCHGGEEETVAESREHGYPCAAPMSRHDFQIPVCFKHRVLFGRDVFQPDRQGLREILAEGGGRRALVVIDQGMATAWPTLADEITAFFQEVPVDLRGIHPLPGGEAVKADDHLVREVWKLIDAAHLDRHSYLLAIGGGAFLDAAGFAAATAHRGVRLIRFPTTTLSQDDSGVGVKCAINGFGRKNWIGAFAVPFAVIHDFRFLHSQDEDTRRAGLIEAVKVALVKDAAFFAWIEAHAADLAALEPTVLEECVQRSSLLHAQHIATSGDPFETGSSRPLDFGHWAAHKLEALSGYTLDHARAVAIGVALDTLYSTASGMAPAGLADRVSHVLETLRLPTHHPLLDQRDAAGQALVLEGLDEFREHLGGDLTVLMLEDVGRGRDVHEIDGDLMIRCIERLADAVGATA